MDSFCTLAVSLILLLSILAQIQMLFVNPRKLLRVFRYCSTHTSEFASDDKHLSKPELVVHYAKRQTSTDTQSGSRIFLSQLRNILSSPILRRQSGVRREETLESFPVPCASSSFNVTGRKLPIVDITYDYNSVRYRIFKASLRSLYGNNFPPSNVVLNSMQMNACDSRTKIGWSGDDLFDFIGETDPGIDRVARRMEIEYLDPLDHFVVKRDDMVATTDKIIETVDEERREVPVNNARRNRD